ncbi:CHASE2 domain-containing protein [Pelagibius sp. Alg239-R121]|uniref:CHASE2 domain-containing protein n=1 Tax=Pelagibius sp. Alg239-R121 TaxID=2993448 RepID=UPI0024A69E68|nr:adenylate/guanylate cyclase domain-containing protein [Pelagibius sp. Alg239-R121]
MPKTPNAAFTQRIGHGLASLFRRIGFGRFLGAALLGVFLVIRAWDPNPVETLRLKVFDLYQQIHPRALSQQPVLIVDIDERSLSEFGQWPWPRTLLAKLVTQLKEQGAAAIGFDIVFAEADRLSPKKLAEDLSGIAPELRGGLRLLPDNDQLFAEAIGNTNVVLGQSGHPRVLSKRESPGNSAPVVTLGGNPKPYLFNYADILRNIPVLDNAAQGRGIFNFEGERDGLVRRVPAVVLAGGRIVPTLTLEMLRVAAQADAYIIKSDELGLISINLAGAEIPTDRFGRIWVNYSKSDPNKYLPASDVLNETAPQEKVKGKLILIGTSATGLLDIKSTPVHSALPGVEVHAQILETILTKSYLLRPSYALGAELILQALTGAVMILLVPALGASLAMLFGALIAGALMTGSWYLFVEQQLLIDVSYGLFASGAVYILLVFVNYFREEGRRRQVRGAFGQYLAPTLVDQLAKDPKRLALGGETKTMTFLFCDVRGFTSIAELYHSDPQGLTRLINRFLTPLSDCILRNRGTIDKYMGDAIMAFWNAPLEDPEHVSHACLTALDMLGRLDSLNKDLKQEAEAAGRPFLPLHAGIGINTGVCVVGNMGSDQRFDYSVLGDAVNLAARLEGQSKTYGVSIIVGEATAEQLTGRLALLQLDMIRVKGKTKPERIFSVIGDEAFAKSQNFNQLVTHNERLLTEYRAGNWESALDECRICRELDAEGSLGELYALYASRCQTFQVNPPPADWDGVFSAETK